MTYFKLAPMKHEPDIELREIEHLRVAKERFSFELTTGSEGKFNLLLEFPTPMIVLRRALMS